jgi:hypothetical protein
MLTWDMLFTLLVNYLLVQKYSIGLLSGASAILKVEEVENEVQGLQIVVFLP